MTILGWKQPVISHEILKDVFRWEGLGFLCLHSSLMWQFIPMSLLTGRTCAFSLSLESSWASLQVFYKHSFICTSFSHFAIENISEITEFNFDQLTSQLPRKTFRFFLRYISKSSLWIKLQNYSWIFFWKYYEALFNTTYLIMVLFFQTFSSKDFIFFSFCNFVTLDFGRRPFKKW